MYILPNADHTERYESLVDSSRILSSQAKVLINILANMPIDNPLWTHLWIDTYLQSPTPPSSCSLVTSIEQKRLELRRGEPSLRGQPWDFSPGWGFLFCPKCSKQRPHALLLPVAPVPSSHRPVLAVSQVGAYPWGSFIFLGLLPTKEETQGTWQGGIQFSGKLNKNTSGASQGLNSGSGFLAPRDLRVTQWLRMWPQRGLPVPPYHFPAEQHLKLFGRSWGQMRSDIWGGRDAHYLILTTVPSYWYFVLGLVSGFAENEIIFQLSGCVSENEL